MDLLEIIAKPFINADDISILYQCGRNRSYEIMRELEKQLAKQNKRLPRCKRKSVPTEMLLDYLDIDQDRIIRYSNILSNQKNG